MIECIEDALSKQLDKFLERANVTDMEARAVISPYAVTLQVSVIELYLESFFSHAGYSYSGPTAAYAYKNLNKNKM